MASNNEIFDRIVRTQNQSRLSNDSPVRSNLLFENEKNKIDKIIETFFSTGNPLKEKPRIIFDYIDSPVAAAWAKFYEDTYVIALSYGTICTLEFMFYQLLSCPDFMPDYGDVTKEDANLPKISIADDFDETLSQLKFFDSSVAGFIPKCEERRRLAIFLIEAAILFLTGHEFRHVQAGHCDYYEHKFHVSSIEEKPISQKIQMCQ